MLAATAAAKALGQLSTADALALVLLYVEAGDERFERAAARWHATFAREAQLELSESELALAAVSALKGPAGAGAAQVLVTLARRHRVPNLETALRTRR